MQIFTILNGVTANTTSAPVRIDPHRVLGGGPIPILISGVTNAVVTLQGTIATDQEVSEGAALWSNIQGANWSADIADGLFTGFTHIRAVVSSYVAGTIYLKVWV